MKESWLPLIGDPQLMEHLALVIFKPMARGFLPDEHRTLMVGGRQVPVSKWPKKGVRPLLVGSAWRRLLARGLLGERKREVLDFFQANSRVQQFVSAEDGAASCFHMVAVLERQVRE
jgi:hypothetical protein